MSSSHSPPATKNSVSGDESNEARDSNHQEDTADSSEEEDEVNYQAGLLTSLTFEDIAGNLDCLANSRLAPIAPVTGAPIIMNTAATRQAPKPKGAFFFPFFSS